MMADGRGWKAGVRDTDVCGNLALAGGASLKTFVESASIVSRPVTAPPLAAVQPAASAARSPGIVPPSAHVGSQRRGSLGFPLANSDAWRGARPLHNGLPRRPRGWPATTPLFVAPAAPQASAAVGVFWCTWSFASALCARARSA
jgi:hypothetical protein